MSVTHPTTTLDDTQLALPEAFRALEAIGGTFTTTQRTTVWEIVTARLGALEHSVEEAPSRPLRAGERIIADRLYYSAAWLCDLSRQRGVERNARQVDARQAPSETDFADLGRQATLLIATTEHAGDEADAYVAGLALSIDGKGLGLARGAFGGACDELDTVLPPSRAVPLLVNALAEVGDLYDPTMEALAEQAPGHLEPWGHDWMSWLVENTFFDS
jgi:hypothetical protein